jgi:hypothetical protein
MLCPQYFDTAGFEIRTWDCRYTAYNYSVIGKKVPATQRVERLGESQDAVSADVRGGKDPNKTTSKLRSLFLYGRVRMQPLFMVSKRKKLLFIFPPSMSYKVSGAPWNESEKGISSFLP